MLRNFEGNNFFTGTVETKEFTAMAVRYNQMEGIAFRDYGRLWVTNEKYTRRIINIKSRLREFRITEPQIVNDPDTEPTYPEEPGSTEIKDENIDLQTVFPNPAHDSLTVRFDEPYLLEIIDCNGIIVYSSQNENTGETTIDISVLVPGNYILRLTTQDSSREYKFIKL